MSQGSRKNRLSPPFMHAFRVAFEKKDARQKLDLRDEAGERVVAARRSAARGAVTEAALRREVARDLENLVNATALESSEDLSAFDAVRGSILNYGLPDLIHRTIDDAGVEGVGAEIAAAVKRYEPRLAPATVSVARDDSFDGAELRLRFLVRADLICAPVNAPVEFVADVEIDSSAVAIRKA
ncbi:type VI secretion system baseplate subunit TssE [Methylocella sp.]|uniref:type VI secretion system baseplate subunit TssE n=1 Tax=Methylocella sp. TaxID=1978226 RepID=UPI0037848B87